MTKTLTITLASLTLTACAAGGANGDFPPSLIGPDAKSPGVFSGEDGVFSGTIALPKSTEEKQTEKETATKTGAEDEEYQAWKKAREQEDYEAWKRAKEAGEL